VGTIIFELFRVNLISLLTGGQRSHLIAPQILASKKESDFEDAVSPIAAFIKSEWPNAIDGIAIEAE
jgi:hypothetical protein